MFLFKAYIQPDPLCGCLDNFFRAVYLGLCLILEIADKETNLKMFSTFVQKPDRALTLCG